MWGLPFRIIPVGAQFIIFAPFVRVAEDFVGLGFVFCDIGVKLSCQLAEGLLDFCAARFFIDAENLIIILKFNRRESSLLYSVFG